MEPESSITKSYQKECGCIILVFPDKTEIIEKECEKHFYENLNGEDNA